MSSSKSKKRFATCLTLKRAGLEKYKAGTFRICLRFHLYRTCCFIFSLMREELREDNVWHVAEGNDRFGIGFVTMDRLRFVMKFMHAWRAGIPEDQTNDFQMHNFHFGPFVFYRLPKRLCSECLALRDPTLPELPPSSYV